MPNFDTYSLNSYKVGGQNIGVTVSEKLLHIAGEDWDVDRWLKTVARVNAMLKREGLIQETKQNGPPARRSSNFLSVNLEQIHGRHRGVIKAAPWWLRWLYDAVIDKHQYSGSETLD